MFEIASTVSQVNQTFYFIFAVCIFFFIGIPAAMIYFVVRYRRERNPVVTDIEGVRWMEVLWTTVPTLLTLGMFYYGWLGFMDSSHALEGATEITVTARKYNWMFKYPNGKVLTEMYVAAGRPMKANLTTEDVIHSFFIPAFRIKEDCVPGQTNHLTFTPLTEGAYDIYCTEYCGAGHATMLSRVVAMRPKDYDIWYKSRESQKPINLKEALAGPPELLKRGEVVYKTNCVSCHGPNRDQGLPRAHG
ncbi:MAG: cytochrome c oxidase subunit II [Candidatus Sumerlaeota bacterium]|nr:cytochrome c oxidase subunit II [Candidatus Sumerlaeota bacterium]